MKVSFDNFYFIRIDLGFLNFDIQLNDVGITEDI